MGTKADLARQRISLQAERLHLKQARLELETERRLHERERLQLVAALRLLCERYGDNTWDEHDELAEIAEQHLARPLADRLAQIQRRLTSAQAALDRVQPPRETVQAPPPVPVDLPAAPGHQPYVEADRGQGGTFRAGCSCGWKSAGAQGQPVAVGAVVAHIHRMAPTGPQSGAGGPTGPGHTGVAPRPLYPSRLA